tara:strand:+ start:1041 stop:1871 length:831 start_codon:yes stop_codon:yes gene_type:complete
MEIENITFVITTFNSEKIILSCIKNLPKYSKKIVIENSGNHKLKKILTDQFTNIRVEVMDENLGYGRANNIGIKLSTTDYVFILNPDVFIKTEELNFIFDTLKNLNFAIASPIEKKEINKFNFNNEIYKEVNEVKGFAMILNKNRMKGELFDENFFLYLEEIDLCKRIKKLKEKILLLNIGIDHLGGKSHDSHYNLEMEKSRNWHWMWSKFYFYKKHYGYLHGFIKTLPNLISSFIKFLFFFCINEKIKSQNYKMRCLGLASSYLLKKSYYRPLFD